MTTFADLVYQLGGLPAGLALVPPGGAWLWVDPANGGDGNDGLTPGTALATVGAAYAKCTANRNDVVALIGGPTASVEAAAIDWAKNYTHLLGFCAPVHEGQRARITQLSTLTGASPFLIACAPNTSIRAFFASRARFRRSTVSAITACPAAGIATGAASTGT